MAEERVAEPIINSGLDSLNDDVEHGESTNELDSEAEARNSSERGRCPPARKRRCRISNLVKESHRALPAVDNLENKHNTEHSRLHQLPAELLLQILDEICRYPDAIFSMRLVARDFYPLFDLPIIIGFEERESFKAALRRDDLTWYSRWERSKGISSLAHAVCGACRCRHTKSQFSDEELAKEPEERICIGAKEMVSVHENRKDSLNKIRDLGPDFSKAGFQKIFISKSSAKRDGSSPVTPFLDAIICHKFNLRQLEVFRHFCLLSLPESSRLNHNHLIERLTSIRSMLCSHFRADEVHGEGSVLFLRPPKWKVERGVSQIYDGYEYKWTACWCSEEKVNCDAFYALHRRKSEQEEGIDEIILTACNIYQPSSDEVDPEWPDRIVQELVRDQINFNKTMHQDIKTILYKAKGKGEWQWSAVESIPNVPEKDSIVDEDAQSLRERWIRLRQKRRAMKKELSS